MENKYHLTIHIHKLKKKNIFSKYFFSIKHLLTYMNSY